MTKKDFLNNAEIYFDTAMMHPEEPTIVGNMPFHFDDVVQDINMEFDFSNFDEYVPYLFHLLKDISVDTDILKMYTPKIATPKWYEEKVKDGLKRISNSRNKGQDKGKVCRKRKRLTFRILLLYMRRDEHGRSIFTGEKL